ncbi:MAG: hypothetical protein ACPGD4_04990 [Paracoccaceae bacterium]
MFRVFACVAICLFPMSGIAQERAQTLADIRQDLNILYVEIQRLKGELSTTQGPSVSVAAGSVLERVQNIETELQRLTALSEELQFRVERVVQDGTNRVGDLEFRLVELEGGDISTLGETTTLGVILPIQRKTRAKRLTRLNWRWGNARILIWRKNPLKKNVMAMPFKS